MQERWLVTLGFLPMAVGLVGLLALRGPAAGAARPGLDRGAAGALPAATRPDQRLTRASYPGVVLSGHTAELGAELGGSVVRVFVREGASVHAGDPLVAIDPAVATSDARMAKAELARQTSSVARAHAEHLEASDLLSRLLSAGSGVPEHTLVAARSREASARAAWEEARAGLDLGKARIEREQTQLRKHQIGAPFAGTVIGLYVDPGDVVAAGAVVARVVSHDLHVRFAVPPADRSLQRVGAAVSVRHEVSGASIAGRVIDVLPEVDAASGLVFVRAELEPAGQPLVLGTRVEVSGAEP